MEKSSIEQKLGDLFRIKSKLITFMADKQNTEKWIRRITGVQIKQMVTLNKINPFF